MQDEIPLTPELLPDIELMIGEKDATICHNYWSH